MSSVGRAALVLLIALAAASGGYWYGRHHAPAEAEHEGATTALSESEADEKPVVAVQTVPLRKGTITETIKAYGSVIAEAGDVRAMSVPFESRVVRVPVAPGQPVAPGADLIEVEASPDALIALQEAKNALEGATGDLKQAEQRFDDHLATNQELSQAKQALQSAQLKLKSLTDRGVGQSQTIKAPAAGIVSKVDVQEGQIVQAGTALVELAAGNRLEVRLGVEPADAQALKVDQPVKLQLIDRAAGNSSEGIEGKVRTIGRRVDPATRMIEVIVSLPGNTDLPLDTFVTGHIERTSADALIVPRDAALPGETDAATLFTLRDGKAVKHTVHLGLENDKDVQVVADDLKPDEPIVVRGNYLLEDGMSVTVSMEGKP